MIEGTTEGEDAAYLAVTIAMAVLPLATSIMALYLGWLSSDPIKGELKKQHIHIAKVQEQRAVIGAAKAELGSTETRRERLMIRETELYHDALRQLAAEEDAENAMAQEAFFQGRSANEIGPFVEWLRDHPEKRVLVAGSTATAGTPEGCLTLSRDRASTVADMMIAEGVAPNQLVCTGVGQESHSLRIPDTTPDGQLVEAQAVKNRCVFLITLPSETADELMRIGGS